MKSGIYSIRCVTTNQRYVGTAIDWEKRISQHISKLRAGKHKNNKLQNAWGKFGAENFEFQLVEACEIDILLERECFWAEYFETVTKGFNSSILGNNGCLRHGQTYSLAYKSWESMKQRCTNPKSSDYKRYGAIGIKICERWLNFDNFYADMGDRAPSTSLDRFPNKNGNYEPGNCRWATAGEQQRNISSNLYLTYEGESKLVVDLAFAFGIPAGVLRRRIKYGVVGPQLFAPTYKSFAGVKNFDGVMPKRFRNENSSLKKFTCFGKTLSISEWAIELGISRDLLSQRILRRKTPLEKALTRASLKRGKVGPRKGHKMITAFGKTQSLTCWAREYKLPVPTLKNRLYRAKMLPETALTAQLYAKQRRIDHT